MHVADKILNVLMCRLCNLHNFCESKWMPAVCSKDVSSSSSELMLVVVANLAKVLLKVMNQFIQKHHQNQTVILIIQMNIMKTTYLKIYQLQWTLRIKIMMINGFR